MSAVVFAIAAGFLVWGDVPDLPTLIGSAVIIGAGLYTLYREHKLARAGPPLIAAPASIDAATGADDAATDHRPPESPAPSAGRRCWHS